MTPADSDRPRLRQVLFLLLCLILPLSALFDRAGGYAGPALGALLFVLWRPAFGEKPPAMRTLLRWLAALGGLALLSTLWSLNPSWAAARAVKIAAELLAGGLLVGILPRLVEKIPPRRLWLLPASYALSLAVLLFDFHTHLLIYRHLHPVPADWRAPLDALNRSIMFSVLAFPAMAGMTLALPGLTHGKRARLAAALTVLLLAVLAAAASQSAKLAFILIAAMAVLFPYRWRLAWQVTAVAVAGLILVTPWLAQALFSHVAPAAAALPWYEAKQAFIPNRLEIWDTVSRYALRHPLHGFGVDATRLVPAFDTKQIYQHNNTFPHPHNFAVQLWMEFGVLGALLGAGMLGSMILYLMNLKSRAQQHIALPTLIACVSIAAMTFSLWQGWWLGLLFLTAGLSRMAMALYGSVDKEAA